MDEQEIQISLDEMLREKRFARLKLQRKQLCHQTENESVSLPLELMSLPPIPYRIAKALDPSSYRNVEMDLWLQQEKRSRLTPESEWSPLPLNTRCLFTPPQDASRKLVCFVVSKVHGCQVQVFVPSLKKK